jgi:hypothetical protein
MTKPVEPGVGPSPAAPTSIEDDTREPYEAPRMDVEQLFETLALACGKRLGQSFACNRIPNQS